MREGRVGCGRVRVRVQAGPRGPESRPGALSPAMQMRVLGHRAMPRNSTKTDLVFVPPILDETRFGFRAATQPRTSRRSRTRQPRTRTQLVPLEPFVYQSEHLYVGQVGEDARNPRNNYPELMRD
jgi:hypothetical protein